MVSVLEAVTAKFEVNFLNSFSVLDELLTKTNPGSADARILKNNVPNNLVTLRRFFSALENPRWLDPLKQQGFFSHVPETVPDEDGNARFQPWAESPYLVRIAGLADYQEKVLAIAREIPDTENIYVHEDLADIALVLPPHLSAGLVSKLQHCLENSRNVLLPNKAGALVSHLAKGQQTKAALDLARTLLAVIPRPSLQKAAADAEEPEALLDLRPEPDARFDTWIYERIIEKNIPDLVSIAGLDAFLLLCDLLETALVSSRSENSQGPEDYSYIWRPDISDREEKHYHRVRDVLVSAVRDAGKEN
jgi:hypothetical protein